MRLDDLHLWYLGDPNSPRYVGALRLISTGKGVSLRYHEQWLRAGFALSEDLPLIDTEHLPPARLASDGERAVGERSRHHQNQSAESPEPTPLRLIGVRRLVLAPHLVV